MFTVAAAVLLLILWPKARGAEFWAYSWPHDGWHFYADGQDQLRIHRVNRAFPFLGLRVSSSKGVTSIVGAPEWLYFLAGTSIGRVRYDGTQEELLPNVQAFSFDVWEEDVFYLNAPELLLCTITNGKPIVLVPGQCADIDVEGGQVYFSSHGNGNYLGEGIFVMNRDGSEVRRLLSAHEFVALKEHVYFIDESDDRAIWVYSVNDGSSERMQNTENSVDLVVRGGRVYFRDYLTGDIYYIDPAGKTVRPA